MHSPAVHLLQGYDKLMACLGSNLAEFLGNLNNLHLHLSTTYPAMLAPRFKAEVRALQRK